MLTFGSGGRCARGKPTDDLMLTTHNDGHTVAGCYARGSVIRSGSDEERLIYPHAQNEEANVQREQVRGIQVINEVHITR